MVPPAALRGHEAAVLQRARAGCPALDLPPPLFLSYLAARLPTEGDLGAHLAAWHLADLYLACGCARGDAVAVAAFERGQLARVPAYLAALGRAADPDLIDEARQRLRVQLLVAAPPEAPRIAGYSGRGPLGGWLRIAAVREALHLARGRGRRAPPLPDDGELLARLASPALEQQAALLRGQYGAQLRAAFREALGALDPAQRGLLRRHFLDGVTLPRLAAMQGLSRATCVRAIAGARAQVLGETRRRLAERLRVGLPECDSLLRELQSQLDSSLVQSALARDLASPR